MYNDLSTLRLSIESCDAKLLDLLAQRMHLVHNIADYKKRNGLPVKDCVREQDLVEKMKRYGGEKGLDPNLIAGVYSVIFDASCMEQEHLLNFKKS